MQMKAYAYVVGPQDGPGAGLLDMARTLGFSGVAPFTTLAQAEQQAQSTPICYFLFATTDNIGGLRNVADTIRFSSTRRLRFSPLIYFAETASVEDITACLNMGFDDIITMPFSRQRVQERIQRQIGQTLVYYETASYFGPDRRGRVAAPARTVENRAGGQFRRIEIVRNMLSGTNVLRDDLFSAAPGAATNTQAVHL